jgi:hypothetical protein
MIPMNIVVPTTPRIMPANLRIPTSGFVRLPLLFEFLVPIVPHLKDRPPVYLDGRILF